MIRPEDEAFARDYRPSGGAFGSLGAEDFFEGDDDQDAFDYEDVPAYDLPPQRPPGRMPEPIAAVGGPWAVGEDPGAGSASTGAGVTLLWLVAGGAAGYYYGRDVQRTLGGVLAAGGARNLYRSTQPTGETAGRVTMGVIGLGGLGVGVALLLGAFDKK